MPKRSREDSPSPPPLTTESHSPTPDPSSPASIDVAVHSSKYLQIYDVLPAKAVMKCSLPPHSETLEFSTFVEFEVHYSKAHTYRCLECHKNFPTEHFLGLHINENHDPLNEARRATGEKTYQCFVEGCDKVCATPQKRRMHLTDKHMFPKKYDFLIVNTGIDKRSSMLRSKHRRRSSAVSRALHREQRSNGVQSPLEPISTTPEASNFSEVATENGQKPTPTHDPSADVDIDELASTMSSLKFVPPSVRFGRGGRRGGLSRS